MKWLSVLIPMLVGCSPDRPGTPSTNVEDVRLSPESAALALEKQKYIWDIEHAAFELEKKFGSAFKAALRGGDAVAVEGFCRLGFQATIPKQSPRVREDRGYIRQARGAAGQEAASPADISQWAGHLCAYLSDFAQVDNISLRVIDLHADARNPKSGRWRAKLYLSGTGTDSSGALLAFVSEHQVRCSFVSDEDVEAGVILDQWDVQSENFVHCDRPLFEEATARVGLDQVDIQDNWNAEIDRVRQYYSQMAVEDFDRDGFLDLAVASANGRWRLLRSAAGERFEDVTHDHGIPPWAYEEPRSRSVEEQAFLATWIDFDNDGYPDLILGDRLFHNQQGGRFLDVTDKSGLGFGYNPKGCVVADYDCDGRLDLYVLYQNSRDHSSDSAAWVGDDESGQENQLWRNDGGGRFTNVTKRANAGGGRQQSFAAAWLHANDDHYPDLYIANDFGTNKLLINQGDGAFEDVSAAAGVSDYATSMGVAAGDLTGDGRSDVYVANMFSKMGRRIIAHVDAEDYPAGIFDQIRGSCAGNRLYSPTSTQGTYIEISEDAGVNQVGWAYAPALADFDGDGWLDVYATTGFLSFRRDKPDG